MLAEHVRLRAPGEHGEALQLPPISSGASMVDSNRSLLSGYPDALNSIRDLARTEVRTLALRYSQSYCDASLPDATDTDAIVMAGHQPTLFHPGVWFKSFALDSVAQAANATAINLVVDNDLSKQPAVRCPVILTGGFVDRTLSSVPFDSSAEELAFEMSQVVDRKTFEEFGERLAQTISPLVGNPLIESLWPEVLETSGLLSMPASIAAGRHRLETKHGLSNLELPVSLLSTTRSFAKFVEYLVCGASHFREIYNASLFEFRKANRIRSRSHPVPELESREEFEEVPFWVWTRELPNRRRLFTKATHKDVEMTDFQGWSVKLSRPQLASDFQELNQLDSDVFIRPRALATTMFSRLFASDLFLHGIGGAKYDQLGDEIARQFFEVAPPEFMTATATMKLPFNMPSAAWEKVTQLEMELRELRCHPDRELVGDPRALRKMELVKQRPAKGSRKSWHDEIAAINKSLFEELVMERKDLESRIAMARENQPLIKLMNSREFSFALFPHELIEHLKVLAR